jgi:SAM-dependent methyltransferase
MDWDRFLLTASVPEPFYRRAIGRIAALQARSVQARPMSLMTRFIAANQQLSRAVENWLPAEFKRHIQTLYNQKVAELINVRPSQIVLDAGGGKECPFLPYVDSPSAHLIIALDISEEELRRNRRLKCKVVADATGDGLPFRDGSADLIVSRSTVEHLRDNTAFFANCTRVLRPGGVMVHAFPGRFAPFALVNRVLPNRLTRRLIRFLHPEWREEDNYGFLAFYDLCYFSGVRDLLDRNGFRNTHFYFLFYQSLYFNFCFPLFALILLYDLIAWAVRIRNLASGIVVTAQRPAGDGSVSALLHRPSAAPRHHVAQSPPRLDDPLGEIRAKVVDSVDDPVADRVSAQYREVQSIPRGGDNLSAGLS